MARGSCRSAQPGRPAPAAAGGAGAGSQLVDPHRGPGPAGTALVGDPAQPHLAGAGCPNVNTRARGVFWGATLGHHRGHFVRAIMESVAFMVRGNLELLTDLGAEIREVRCLGGAARSDLWLQIKADMLGIPVERPECSDASSLGAAMLAAAGAGTFDDVGQASEAWYRPSRVFDPDLKRHKIYEGVVERYLALYESLYGH